MRKPLKGKATGTRIPVSASKTPKGSAIPLAARALITLEVTPTGLSQSDGRGVAGRFVRIVGPRKQAEKLRAECLREGAAGVAVEATPEEVAPDAPAQSEERQNEAPRTVAMLIVDRSSFRSKDELRKAVDKFLSGVGL